MARVARQREKVFAFSPTLFATALGGIRRICQVEGVRKGGNYKSQSAFLARLVMSESVGEESLLNSANALPKERGNLSSGRGKRWTGSHHLSHAHCQADMKDHLFWQKLCSNHPPTHPTQPPPILSCHDQEAIIALVNSQRHGLE